MTKYYLKMDNIMKNMFVVALNDELQAQSEQDECLEETKALLKKVSEYDLAQKRLQITAGEQRQIRKALNRLRSKYLAAGRYSDGIDKIYSGCKTEYHQTHVLVEKGVVDWSFIQEKKWHDLENNIRQEQESVWIRWTEKRVCRRDWKELCSMWMMQVSSASVGTTAEVSH